LHKQGIALKNELSPEFFSIFMTKEVGSFEILSIPEDTEERRNLVQYIRLQVAECGIGIDSFFGFSSYNDSSEYKSRVGGFNQGRWVTYEEGELLKKFQVEAGRERKTGLYKDEADASLAVRACTGGIVITAESKTKNGPLKRALSIGGKVLNIGNLNLKEISQLA